MFSVPGLILVLFLIFIVYLFIKLKKSAFIEKITKDIFEEDDTDVLINKMHVAKDSLKQQQENNEKQIKDINKDNEKIKDTLT